MLKGFRDFAMKGNVLDMAVGIIIGGAIGTIIRASSLDGADAADRHAARRHRLHEHLSHPQGGTPAGPYADLAAAQTAGAVTINVGLFMNAVISFLIVAWAVFMLVKAINTAKKKEAAAPAAPPEPPRQELLLAEIRDLLKAK